MLFIVCQISTNKIFLIYFHNYFPYNLVTAQNSEVSMAWRSIFWCKSSLFSVIFFFDYLLRHQINKRMRQSLILLCEAHFAVLYILQLSLVSRKLEQKGSLSLEVLSELGGDFISLKCLTCITSKYLIVHYLSRSISLCLLTCWWNVCRSHRKW